jgi:AmiR/NasT family two-component response regulator
LMASGMSEAEAHAELRARAQTKRVPIEAIADEIVAEHSAIESKTHLS